jgi:hypothetical protein
MAMRASLPPASCNMRSQTGALPGRRLPPMMTSDPFGGMAWDAAPASAAEANWALASASKANTTRSAIRNMGSSSNLD